MVDLWLMQSQRYIDEALDEGFRQFTWHVAALIVSRYELFSWVRAHSAAYGPIKVMLIDHSGAAEYSTFAGYEQPLAVYPTWAPDEGMDNLELLMKKNVAEDQALCTNSGISVQMRPVYGQKHRVVVHRLPSPGHERQLFMLQMRQIQLRYPRAELFISGCTRFSDLFGLGFKAVDYIPAAITPAGLSNERVVLPTGKLLITHTIHDPRYNDWFDLIGMPQYDVLLHEDRIRFCLRAAKWASRNFDRVTPFVKRTTRGGGNNTVFMNAELFEASDRNFVLPAARRKMMRNLGLKPEDYDKFTCNNCILHNACSLYREDSVCTVKGSDAVALADAFGSRNVEVLKYGLSELLKKNAERLEDAMAAEEDGKLDPDVTSLSKTVFDQGVKLVKLIDPSLAGGAKIQVNVGVGAVGSAQVGISDMNPSQMMSGIVAELEAAGIPREDIDSAMVKGVLRNMAQTDQRQAISTAVTKHQSTQRKTIEGSAA